MKYILRNATKDIVDSQVQSLKHCVLSMITGEVIYLKDYVNNHPNTELWYTSVNGNKIDLQVEGFVLGENDEVLTIVSNTYDETIGKYKMVFNKDIVKLTCNDDEYSTFVETGNLKTLSLPDSVISISGTCKYCENLETIEFSSNLKTIDNGALDDCKISNIDLSNVTYIGKNALSGNTFTSIDISNVTYLGTAAFSGCSNLESVTIPENVTYNGDAFESCRSLKTINWPTTFNIVSYGSLPAEVGEGEDYYISIGGTGIESIIMPEGCTSVGAYAATSLNNIILPSTTKYLRMQGFYGCSSLTSITIPSSVVYIADEAFGYDSDDAACPLLTDINYEGTITQWNAITKQTSWVNGLTASSVTVHCTNGNVTIK